ncbi:4232_t:CDS:2, partial [Paraglomus brasilianum]
MSSISDTTLETVVSSYFVNTPCAKWSYNSFVPPQDNSSMGKERKETSKYWDQIKAELLSKNVKNAKVMLRKKRSAFKLNSQVDVFDVLDAVHVQQVDQVIVIDEVHSKKKSIEEDIEEVVDVDIPENRSETTDIGCVETESVALTLTVEPDIQTGGEGNIDEQDINASEEVSQPENTSAIEHVDWIYIKEQIDNYHATIAADKKEF